MVAQCPNKTLLIEGLDEEEEVEEEVYEPNIDDIVEIGEDVSTHLGCNKARPLFDDLSKGSLDTLVASVVRCTLAQSKESDDWKRNAIFQTIVKCGTKDCKVIINSGSYINSVSSKLVSHLGLKLVAHSKLYKVSWADDSSITIKERCLVPIHILSYKAQILCDVIPMDVGHIILR